MSFIFQNESFVEETEPGNPRIIHHRRTICGTPPKGFLPWAGVVNVRLPHIQGGPDGLPLFDDKGEPQWTRDAKGEVLHRDYETIFWFENIDTTKPLESQLEQVVIAYDKAARQAAEAQTEEYRETLKKAKEKAKASKIVVPTIAGLASAVERQVDENLNDVRR